MRRRDDGGFGAPEKTLRSHEVRLADQSLVKRACLEVKKRFNTSSRRALPSLNHLSSDFSSHDPLHRHGQPVRGGAIRRQQDERSSRLSFLLSAT